jgi:hypothetical protein
MEEVVAKKMERMEKSCARVAAAPFRGFSPAN